jgi:ribosomal protein S18 acetylase RimI-like enzyme
MTFLVFAKPRLADAEGLHSLVYEGISDQVQEGLSPLFGVQFPVSIDDGVIWADTPKEEPVGIITFRRDKNRRAAVLTCVYVEPSSRRMGVFTKMTTLLKETLVQEGLTRVLGTVHVRDKVGLAAFQKVGLLPRTCEMEMRL